MADIYLHVGLPKTGTTTIQAGLDRAREALAEHGVLVPGANHDAHRRAAFDLIGQRVPGRREPVAGAFDALVAELGEYDGAAAIVSEEGLCRARPRHVRRVERCLSGHRLHVVVGVRDLARSLTSAWQQAVVGGSTTTWSDYVAGVRDPRTGSVRAATSFRLQHDVLGVLDVWAAGIPPERVHVVTLPPRGAPRSLLLERFARATRLPDVCWDTTVPQQNRSLGAAEVELVRQLNEALAGRIAAGLHRVIVDGGLRRGWQGEPSRPLLLPAEDLPWVWERSMQVVAELRRRGYAVHGDLADLVPEPVDADLRRLDEVDERELLAAARSGLTALALAQADLLRRHRRVVGRRYGYAPSWSELADSTARATWFGMQGAAVRVADGSGPLAPAARRALRRWLRSGQG